MYQINLDDNGIKTIKELLNISKEEDVSSNTFYIKITEKRSLKKDGKELYIAFFPSDKKLDNICYLYGEERQ